MTLQNYYKTLLMTLQKHTPCPIANSLHWIQIPQHHDWAANFKSELGQWKPRCIDGIEVFHWIEHFSLIPFPHYCNRVCTVVNPLLSWEVLENCAIDVVNIFIPGREKHAISEVLIRW